VFHPGQQPFPVEGLYIVFPQFEAGIGTRLNTPISLSARTCCGILRLMVRPVGLRGDRI
jgi:hypothetical protein